MARAGMGTSAFTTQGEPLTAKVINQLKNGLQPCISEVFVKWGKTNDFEGGGDTEIEIVETKKTLFGYGKATKKITKQFTMQSQVPSKIPAIYDGSRLIAYKLLDKNIEVKDEIIVKAKTPEGDLEVSLEVCKDSFIDGNSVHQLFARKMIQEIEEKPEKENAEERKKLITELGLKYKLASKYTSFVGVDETQGKSNETMVTRHIKNQMPQNGGSGIALGGFRSASFSVVDSAPRTRGYMSPPGASYKQSKGGSRTGAAPPGAAPPGASRSFGSMTMSDNAVDSACMSDSSDDGYDCLESLTRSAPRSVMSSQASSSDVVRLTMDQTANGSFLPKESIANIIDVEHKKLMEAGRSLSTDAKFENIWMTLVVVAFLTEKCKDECDIWELVVEKAKKWLQSQDPAVKDHLEKAKEFIKEAVPSRRVCPSGHKLSMVPTGSGNLWHCDSDSKCVGGCNSDGEHPHQTVWRCSQDKRVTRGGSCDFDICGECVKQNV